jgi:RNA polymerase sigma-70 factor (ECF subfamily)
MSPLFFKRLSDESLGSRLASGEAAAFDELYRRYAHRLAAYGSHLLGDAASGDDVAQATMLKAYAALRSGRVPDRMKPWLFRIAHNTAIDLVVRRRELPAEDLPETASVEPEPFAGVLVEALALLPDRQRRVYLLREVHGLRIDETAAELGLTASQVEQSLFTARNRLAEQLVFGDRLNCVTVQRLAVGPLDASERRALKPHLRSCGACRQVVGLRGRALTLFPSAWGLEWLRGIGAGLVGGGGAPAAAKVGAIFATATLAAGVPVAVEHSKTHHAHRPAAQLVDPATAVPPRASAAATRRPRRSTPDSVS